VQREVTADGLHLGRGGDPAGSPVVFVHGAMDRGAAFLRVTRLLADLDWWVYDRRGYGRSLTEQPAELDDHVADLIGILEVVRDRSTGRPVVAGHSLGGTIALAAAHRRPDLVAAVVSYESPLMWADWWPRRGPGGSNLEDDAPAVAAEAFMRRVAGDAVWESLPEATRLRRLEEGSALVAELRSARRVAAYVPVEITVPAVVARGSSTDEHRERAASVLHEEIPGAELVLVEGADHGAHVSRPEEFAALVRRALTRAASAGRSRDRAL
jgi:pimeloyl-ACP methyl ester carboxylesterase